MDKLHNKIEIYVNLYIEIHKNYDKLFSLMFLYNYHFYY